MLFAKLKMAAAWSGAIGLSYALNICTINVDIEKMPENDVMKKSDITIKNGFSVCFRFNSLNFSVVVGNGCKHDWFSLRQELQDL